MNNLNDAQLIEMVRAGNRDAFGILFERYLPMAQNIAQNMIHDRATAEDIAQEAMLQAYLSLKSLKDPTRYGSWLHGIVRNVSHSHLRLQSKWGIVGGEEWQAWDPDRLPGSLHNHFDSDPAYLLEQRLHRAEIQQAIAQLAPKRQEAATLFYLEQLSIREIAQKLKASETAIKSRLFQARKELRIQLVPLFGDQSERMGSRLAGSTLGDNRLADGEPTSNKRKHKMIKIDSVHAFEQGDDKYAIVCFVAKKPLRYLEMWVGLETGHTLEAILNGESFTRPMTHHTMAQMLDLVDAEVSKVEVNALKETTFYGVIHLESNGLTKQLDTRPSDAVTLALIAGAPIYVADAVMTKSGHDLPTPFDEAGWLAALKSKHREQVQLLAKWQEALSTDGATLTKRAKEVCTRMMAEAGRYEHHYVGTEHLLLGLASEKQSISGKVLTELDVSYDSVEALMDKLVGRSEHPPATALGIVPRVANVFELAEKERARMGHTYLGTEHLLLGIIAEGDTESSDKKGMALRFLNELSVDVDDVRQKVLDAMSHGGK
ncbi:MAG: bifunctional nuclease domain-containing protein [Chloroflexota bacterium]